MARFVVSAGRPGSPKAACRAGRRCEAWLLSHQTLSNREAEAEDRRGRWRHSRHGSRDDIPQAGRQAGCGSADGA